MSLFAEYIRETQGREIVEASFGFATYIIAGEACYIEDIFVQPEFRKQGMGSKLADSIKTKAISAGCKRLIGTVNCTFKDPTSSLKALLAYGFEIDKVLLNVIVLKLEVA